MAREPEETALRKIRTSPDGWRGVMGERVVRDDREGRTGTGGEERPERGPAVGRGQQRGGEQQGRARDRQQQSDHWHEGEGQCGERGEREGR